MVIFLSDLNADDDTVTSTSQFIREEVIFTPAAGTLSTYAYFWILYGVWMETIAKAQKRVGKINYAVALIHNTPFRYHIFTSCRDDTAQRNTPLRSCNFAQHIDALLKLPTARCCTYIRAVKQHAVAQRQLHTTRHNHFPYAVALIQLMTIRRRANKSKSFF